MLKVKTRISAVAAVAALAAVVAAVAVVADMAQDELLKMQQCSFTAASAKCFLKP